MTNWGFEDNDTNELGNNTELDGPKALRDAYKKQGEKLDKALSFIAQMEEREQKRELASVFSDLGVPSAAKLYTGEADPEKAKAWVETMRGVFGGAAPEAATEQPAAPTLPPSMQSQFERMTQAGSEGTPLGNVEAAQAAINDATSVEALKAA